VAHSPSITARAVPNALAGETSPYLLQHAFNPVDWRPWSPQAIAEARAANKPLFVSIGYATCYWCHVMERESFEDPVTAEVLNRLFVPVKVDREQRPDIDDVFMTACQVFTRMTEGRPSGGWPLSIFVEPHTLKPFFVGTYFPPRPAYGRPSFRQALESLSEAWTERRADVTAQAEQIAESVTLELAQAPTPRPLATSLATESVAALMRFYDRQNGGFGGAPKFPQPVYLELLALAAPHDPAAAGALHHTLDAMAQGGIFDQIGGGFHRYAVDAHWTVPHFEKMLYDNAQLLSLYARSDDHWHRAIATRIADYVLREMTAPDGAFFSAQDAEVDAREGGSYVWTPAEVRAACGELGDIAVAMYGLDRGTNFQDPHHAHEPATNVLVLGDRPEAVARRLGLDDATFAARRRVIDDRMLAARGIRKQPITDDKVLTAWNGLMIAALAEAGMRLERSDYVRAAQRAAGAMEARMRAADGTLLRSSREGRSTVPAFLEDYAAMIRAYVVLELAMPASGYRTAAEQLFAETERLFGDPRGGYFDWREGANELFVRARSVNDGAVPSGNSMMLLNALDLLARTGDDRYRRSLARSFAGLSGILAEQPVQSALAVVAIARAVREAPETLPGVRSGAPRDDEDLVQLAIEPSAFPQLGDAARGTLVLMVEEGWHITRHGEPGGIELHAGDAVIDAEFPTNDRGTIRIPLRLRSMDAAIELTVRVQPCSDTVCQAPRTLRVTIPFARGSREM